MVGGALFSLAFIMPGSSVKWWIVMTLCVLAVGYAKR